METFCPSVRHGTYKCQLAAACIKEARSGVRLRYFAIDVKQAYVKGEATEQEKMFLRPPPHFQTRDDRGVALVWRLQTPLCGQGDAGRIWYRTIHSQLIHQDFERSNTDPCLYVKHYADGTSINLCLYVDHMFITTDARDKAIREFDIMHSKFGITIKENPVFFLGMNIKYIALGRIKLSCKTYIKTLADNWPAAVSGCAPPTPSDGDLVKSYEHALDRERPPTRELIKRYGSKVGSLIYPVPCARPDAAATVGYLARALTFPTPEMEIEVDKCMRYFNSTADDGITFDGRLNQELEAYSDSDCSVVQSTSGYCIMLAGAPIAYASKRQHCIALFSTEAEIMAASLAATEIAYTHEILRDLGLAQLNPTPHYVDNTGAGELAKERKVKQRSKHITRRHLKVREYQAEGLVVVRRVPTADNPADTFTKPVARVAFIKHKEYLMPRAGDQFSV